MNDIRKLLKMYEGFYLSAILIGLSILATFVGIIPGIKSTYALFQETQVLREDTSKLKNKLSILESLDEDALLKQLAITTSALPIEKAIPALFATAEGVGATSGINVLDLTLTSPGALSSSESAKSQAIVDKAFGANRLPFMTHSSGTLEQIREYFSVARSSKRLLRIGGFSISFLSDGTTNMQTSFEGFYTPLPKTIGSLASEVSPLTGKDLEFISTLSNRNDVGTSILENVTPTSEGNEKTNPFSL